MSGMQLLASEATPAAAAEGIFVSAESIASLSIVIYLLLLIFAVVLGFLVEHALPSRISRYIPEASSSLLIGSLAGFIVSIVSSKESQTEFLAFKTEFFFLFLLPPIIFESAISMDPGPFFRNFGAISYFAFAGTFVSALFVGGFVYLMGVWHICFPLTLVESLLFGALISANDPVTVLAIFNQLGVNENLYALVFGESVLNDAVALVLYRAFKRFLDVPFSTREVFKAVGSFFGIFLGSFAIGTVVGVISALVFRAGTFRSTEDNKHGHVLEASLLAMWAYVAYMLADGLELSGIVAVLFCGIVMARYTIHNLSDSARDTIFTFFKILAKCAEAFVFIYMGLSAFLLGTNWHRFMLFLATLVAVNIGRFIHVYPGVVVINFIRRPGRRIPKTHKQMLFVSGLRGGVAVALAISMVGDLDGSDSARAIMSVTLGLAAFTVFFLGGLSHDLVEKLDLRAASPPDISVELPQYSALQAPTDADDGTPIVNGGSKIADGAVGHRRSPSVFKVASEKLRKHIPSFDTLEQRFIQPALLHKGASSTAPHTPAGHGHSHGHGHTHSHSHSISHEPGHDHRGSHHGPATVSMSAAALEYAEYDSPSTGHPEGSAGGRHTPAQETWAREASAGMGGAGLGDGGRGGVGATAGAAGEEAGPGPATWQEMELHEDGEGETESGALVGDRPSSASGWKLPGSLGNLGGWKIPGSSMLGRGRGARK